MHISELKVKNFRAFSEEANKEYCFPLGKQITCIAGHNGIGKSTLLAMLSNCGELKTSKGRHLNGSPFRGEYSQIIKGDKKYDTSGDKCEIIFSDLPGKGFEDNPFPNKLSFRATFQKAEKVETSYVYDEKTDSYQKIENKISLDRYRLIPKKTTVRNTEKKIEWPTFYLGLSRLYPVGESDDFNSNGIENSILKKIITVHQSILNSSEIYDSASTLSISDTDKKRGFGINTNKYNAVANSSGQDNVGQILMAVFSFENLKSMLNEYYCGGLLLIDELDATLHPSAQNKLFDFLYKKSKELNLQIVFTTHSLSLLQHILTSHQLVEKNNSISLLYLTNARSNIEIKCNPTFRAIQNDLLTTYSGVSDSNKIPIMTEDGVARWYLEKILSITKENYQVKYLNNDLGWEQIIILVCGDYSYYSNQITIVDPDISQPKNEEKIKEKLKSTRYRYNTDSNKNTTRILSLPGNQAVEKMFWDYLANLPGDHKFFFDPQIEDCQVTSKSLKENGPEKYTGENELSKIKKWFEDNKWIAEVSFKYWVKENHEPVFTFIRLFCEEYNKIAKRLGIRNVDPPTEPL